MVNYEPIKNLGCGEILFHTFIQKPLILQTTGITQFCAGGLLLPVHIRRVYMDELISDFRNTFSILANTFVSRNNALGIKFVSLQKTHQGIAIVGIESMRFFKQDNRLFYGG